MLQRLRQFVGSTETIHVEEMKEENVAYVNVVSSVELLPEGYSFSLENIIAHNYRGFIKCDPKNFCGVTIRFTDSICPVTHNLFRSGKLNTVGAKTIQHARYSAQVVRQYLSRINGIYIGPDGKLVYRNLIQNTVFLNCRTVLLTAVYNLCKKPNLSHISSIAQDIARWDPDTFPGLMFLAWLKPRQSCTCKKIKKKTGCNCTIRFIIYESGKIVITGGNTTQSVSKSIKLLDLLFSDTDFVTDQDNQIIHNRINARKKELLKNYIQFEGYTKQNANTSVSESFDVLSVIQPKKKRKK